jgi:hypothetical protein
MERWQRKAIQKDTQKFLRELFADEEIPLHTDSTTGEHVIDIGKVYERLGPIPMWRSGRSSPSRS